MRTYSNCVDISFDFALRTAAFTSVAFGMLGYMVGFYAAYNLTHNDNKKELMKCGHCVGKIFGTIGLIGGGIVGFSYGFEASMFVITTGNTGIIITETLNGANQWLN